MRRQEPVARGRPLASLLDLKPLDPQDPNEFLKSVKGEMGVSEFACWMPFTISQGAGDTLEELGRIHLPVSISVDAAHMFRSRIRDAVNVVPVP